MSGREYDFGENDRISLEKENPGQFAGQSYSGHGTDLASIMVGIMVFGIIGGIMAAVVFGIIPWAQGQTPAGDSNHAPTVIVPVIPGK